MGIFFISTKVTFFTSLLARWLSRHYLWSVFGATLGAGSEFYSLYPRSTHRAVSPINAEVSCLASSNLDFWNGVILLGLNITNYAFRMPPCGKKAICHRVGLYVVTSSPIFSELQGPLNTKLNAYITRVLYLQSQPADWAVRPELSGWYPYNTRRSVWRLQTRKRRDKVRIFCVSSFWDV